MNKFYGNRFCGAVNSFVFGIQSVDTLQTQTKNTFQQKTEATPIDKKKSEIQYLVKVTKQPIN